MQERGLPCINLQKYVFFLNTQFFLQHLFSTAMLARLGEGTVGAQFAIDIGDKWDVGIEYVR